MQCLCTQYICRTENVLGHFDILNNTTDENDKLIIGADFNLVLDPVLDKKGGVAFEKKDITKLVQDLCVECHLIVIWRIKHPEERAFTWRNPKASIRLDFWLISDSLQDYVENIKIVPCIKSDHSAVSLHLKKLENSTEMRGRGYWKLNSSLLDDTEFIQSFRQDWNKWLIQNTFTSSRMKWEFLKYKIRYICIKFSSKGKKERDIKEKTLQDKLSELYIKLDNLEEEFLKYNR